jgi:hypothetical protein
MKTSLDCLPCFLRQTLEAARFVTSDRLVHETILREVMRWTAAMDFSLAPPVIGQKIHRRIREITGVVDPYRAVKERHNQTALDLLPDMRALVRAASDPRMMAVRLAIAGNIIDLGVSSELSISAIRPALDRALADPMVGDGGKFWADVERAQRILFLADNAGEIVFDQPLIEFLGPDRVTVAVRGGPAINDATMADAVAAGLTKLTTVIDNGSDAAATLLDDCSPSFREFFHRADLIVAKGQGNFESLSDETGEIYFLFKAKCRVTADHMGVPIGTNVLTKARTRQETA